MFAPAPAAPAAPAIAFPPLRAQFVSETRLTAARFGVFVILLILAWTVFAFALWIAAFVAFFGASRAIRLAMMWRRIRPRATLEAGMMIVSGLILIVGAIMSMISYTQIIAWLSDPAAENAPQLADSAITLFGTSAAAFAAGEALFGATLLSITGTLPSADAAPMLADGAGASAAPTTAFDPSDHHPTPVAVAYLVPHPGASAPHVTVATAPPALGTSL